MTFYILDLGMSTKIGISNNFEIREKTYKNIKNKATFELGKEKAKIIEKIIQNKFKSKTEYIKADFNKVLSAVKNEINKINIKKYYLNFIDIEITVIDSLGLVDIGNILKIINKKRVLKNKELFNVSSYLKSKENQIFIKTIEKDTGRAAIIEKTGCYGGYLVHPFIALDILRISDIEFRIKVYKFMCSDGFKKFIAEVLNNRKAILADVLNDTKQAIDIAIEKAKKEFKDE